MESIILWSDGKPSLWVHHHKGSIYEVINGRWFLNLSEDRRSGTVVEYGTKLTFDRDTKPPSGTDYNDVLMKAAET